MKENNKTIYNMMRTKRILTTLKKFFVLSVVATVGAVTANADTWDGTTPATLSDAGITGTGQSTSPYIINSAKAFAYFGSVMNGNTAYWEIDESLRGEGINLGGETWKYGSSQNAEYFRGYFNGNGVTISNFTLNTTNCHYSGLFNTISGTVERLKVSNVTLTEGNRWSSSCYGVIAACLDGGTMSKCQVETSTMNFTRSANEATFALWGGNVCIGGIVGKVKGDGAVVTDSKVVGFTVNTAEKSCKNTFVLIGGLAGSVSSVSNLNQCGTKSVTVNAPLTRPKGDWDGYGVSAVCIGGVVGNVSQPCESMPTDLCAYKSKLYCPDAAIGPVCGMFLKSGSGNEYVATAQTVSDDYSGENGTVATSNLEKTTTWMYNGYKLGINTAAQSVAASRKNFTKDLDGEGYLDVEDATVTFLKQNSVSGSARNSRTVLWYTQNNGNSSSTTTTQGIYPSYGQTWGSTYPEYYCYYMQGYNVGSYVSSAQAESFINSLAEVKQRAKLTLADEDLGQRGLSSHTIKLTVQKGSEENITWSWYVDGVKMDESSAESLEVSPKYSGSVSIVVQSSDGGTGTLTLPRAYLATMNSPHHEDGNTSWSTQIGTIEQDNKTRGTADNPYVIGTEEELRYWSELSRMGSTIENGYVNGEVVYDDANHFNTSHFELVDNIEMKAGSTDGLVDSHNYSGAAWKARHKFNPEDHFEPICSFSNEEIYDDEHTFRGTFDGKGHIISGLHQVWKGGLLNMQYSEQATMSWGLFGVVGGGDGKTTALIKNLIIKDALLEHDVYNGTFAYANAMNSNARNWNDTRGTNVAVGVLAGMVTKYATIEHVDVRNSAIYASCVDNSVAVNDYSLIDIAWNSAVYHLWVGGVVGRVQSAFDVPHGDVGATVTLRKLSVDVDLDIFPARIKGNSLSAKWASPYNTYSGKGRRLSVFNMGGIVGSMYTTGGYSSLPWPEQAFFTGQMRSMASMSGPIFGYVNYGSMTEDITTAKSAHEHWVGPAGVLTSGYYNNYYLRHARGDEADSDWTNPSATIQTKGAWRSHATAGMLWEYRSSGSQSVTNNATINGGRYYNGNPTDGTLFYFGPLTPTSPDSPLFGCENSNYSGARSLVYHNENTLESYDDLAGFYQGINQGIWKDWAVENNQTSVVGEFNQGNDFMWSWDETTGRPILSSVHSEHLEATLDNMDTPTKITAELQGVKTGLSEYTYAWYDCHSDIVEGHDFKTAAAGGDVLPVTQKSYDQFFYAVAKKGTEGQDDYKYFKSALVRVPGTLKADEISIAIDSNVVVTAATSYTEINEQLLSQRISQSDYYKLDSLQRMKSPADYYSYDMFRAWKHDMKASLYHIESHYNESSQIWEYEERWDPWPTAEGCPDSTEAAYQACFESDHKTVKAQYQKWLMRVPMLLYSYTEFLALDQRSGEFNADAANWGYTYEFNNDPSDTRAGLSWINKDITQAEFDDWGDEKKKISESKKTTLTVTLSPKTAAELTSLGYTVSYQWSYLDGTLVEGERGKQATLVDENPTQGNRGAYSCRVIVEDHHDCNDITLFDDSVSISWGKTYVYVNLDGETYEYKDAKTHDWMQTKAGNDSYDGLSPQTPKATWPGVYAILKENGTWDENQIILIGKSSYDKTAVGFGLGDTGNGNTATDTYESWLNRAASRFMNRNATISSKMETGETFFGNFEMGNCSGNDPQVALFGDTRFENLIFSHRNQCTLDNGSGGYGIIACQYHNLEMGEGLVMEGFPSASSASAEVGPLPGTKIADFQIFGGCNNDSRFLRMDGSVTNYEVKDYLPHPEGFSIVIKSGFYSAICVTGRQTGPSINGIVGTPNRPIKCKIEVDIDRNANNANNEEKGYGRDRASYDIGAILAGNHEGAQYADVDIVVRSGIIGRVSSGSLGNKRDASTFGSEGGFRGYAAYYGTYEDEYFPFDTYFGRCNILIDPESSKMNQSEPDINKRVVISELYGGALGRHMGGTSNGLCMSTFYGKTNITINGGTFDINTVDGNTSSTDMTQSGKYGLRSYGNVTYTVNVDGKNETFYRAQPGIYAAGAGGFNGIGGDELHTNDIRLPYWADAQEKSNYNVTALKNKGCVNPGRVVRYDKYDVYKTKTGDDKVYITCVDSIKNGREYTTLIDPAETSTTITINGGNFFPRKLPQGAGIYGAGNGYVNNQLINYPNQAPNPLAGCLLGKPGQTAVEMNINGGTFNCDIYGGGRGNDVYYAAGLGYTGSLGQYKQSTNEDDYESFGVTRDNYSRNARIVGNVVMNINGGLFKQNIYGSGSGTQRDACEKMAEVIGSTTININGDSSQVVVLGNVYGGGAYAQVREVTNVNIDNGIVYGSVFGGGDNATVGTYGTHKVYAANEVYAASDNQDPSWTSEDIEEKGSIKVSDGNGGYKEVTIGDPKPGATGRDEQIGTGRTNVYTRTSKARVYGDIFGGGNKADVIGDTYVGMSAGYIGGSIFGGGNGVYVGENNSGNKAADVHGFSEVFLNGYTVMWDEMFDIDSWNQLSYDQKAALNNVDGIKTDYLKTWTSNNNRFIDKTSGSSPIWLDPHGQRNAHNVFGGGNAYCSVDSTARVTVTRGMTPKTLLETQEWKDSYYDNDNPHFYVFGGGYGPATRVNNTYVNVGMEGVLTQDATTDEALAKGSSLFVDEDGNPVSTEKADAAGEDSHSIGIFSNGYGIAGYTVLGVLGGGMEGQVNQNTDVIIGGNTFIHRVYGGGYGLRNREAYTVATDYGRVGGNTHVTANGGLINGDIFGGGARGDVDSTTLVEVLRDCKVYGSVYGGGDVASVGNSAATGDALNDTISKVIVGGGIIYRNVFAGGSRGPIYATTLVNVVDSLMNGKPITPYIYGDIYGGGEIANISGNTNVLLEGGEMAGNFYGGGLGQHTDNGDDASVAANVTGNTNVTVNGGSILWSEQCDDYKHGTVYFFDNTAVIPASRFLTGEYEVADTTGTRGFYDWKNGRFVRNHNVYGGGNINCTVGGDANVTLNHGLVTSGLQYYDKTTLSPFAMLWYKTIQNKSYPQFSVLGGGYGKNTLINGNTNVVMNVSNYTGDEEDEDYKKYKSYKSYVEDYGNYMYFENEMLARWNLLDDNQKDLLYGGTNKNVYRRFRASRYAWSGGVHGHVMASVYGGSWAGKVAGNANVTMDGTSGCRNVFGGGVGMIGDNANTDKLGEVSGKAVVTVNAAIISGDVFGGGAGVESKKDADGNPVLDYYDVARVVDSTSVVINGYVTENESEMPIDGTLIFGTVCGGGDVANVGAYQNYSNIAVAEESAKPVTNVTINGGLIFSQVYGGGTGRLMSECDDYTKLGSVYGNTKLSVNTPAGELNAPWLWHRTFGGGMNGTVYGNTSVNINGGNFGYGIYGGGFGRVDTVQVNNTNDLLLTDAAVKGNTHVNITGGEWCISQMWVLTDEEGNDVRAWAPASTMGSNTYSSQYDPEYKRFKINHNIYGGGYACSTIGGSTYVNVTKGMLNETTSLGRSYTSGSIFKENEWKESYDKVGSAHFSVFGAGYGEQTLVGGDTHVDVSIAFDGDEKPSATFETEEIPYYQRFKTLQSLLDVIGGGYNGHVNGETYVHIGGNTFMRRVFTGGYYAPVKETNLLVTSGDIDEVFGGGLIGDVDENTNVQVGCRENVTFDGADYNTDGNAKLFINKNVYGGNDVSGTVGYKDENHTLGQGTYLKMYGGNLYGDVYGGGNGNYLYALGKHGETKVTPNEHYLKTENFEGYDLVYTVPMRPGMISSSHASDAQKIVNISSFRPSTIEANIELYGRSNEDRLVIKGNVFGGGNSATVDGVVDQNGNNSAKVNLRIKDNIDIGGVFLGSDGDELFKDTEANPFLSQFQTLNDIYLGDTIIWLNDPANHGIKQKYLAVENEDRPIVYPHLLDLYFQPVEMSIQPTVKWGVDEVEDSTAIINNATIGIFCCGGNRGNMNVYPAESGDNEGNVVDIKFPKNLVISGHIIGGCNNANYVWHNQNKDTKHVGGYLLGQRKSKNPMIKLLVQNRFSPSIKEVVSDGDSHFEYTGANVYGGCYKSGTINGDVTVDLRSNMLKGLRSDYFDNITDIGASACNVYGGGYGMNSYVYGDTKVLVGAYTNCVTKCDTVRNSSNPAKGMGAIENVNADPKNYEYLMYADEGTSADYIFGGGLQGNVVGNTTVRYYNGHTLHSVTGGSYAGYLWGSTQVLVGYPDYYTVKDGKQGVYAVARKDKSADNLAQTTVNTKGDVEKAIKQEVKLMAGDIISPTLYEAIVEATPTLAVGESAEAFTKTSTAPTMGWDNVAITIDEAIYGGGYSLASSTSVMANNTIVLKYTDQYNTDDETTTLSSVGYGGNTTMVVWDKIEYDDDGYAKQPGDDLEKDVDHITISQQEMTEVDLPHGTDLFGYYYKDKYGHYHYIYEENKYFQGLEYPKPPLYTGTYVSAYDFEAEGGLYGDGHLSFSEGFRTGEIKGYGFNGGRTIEGSRLMNSFQRMDILRVEDCNVIMLGARDYATNVTNSTPYSMSRIGELQMVSRIDDRGDLRPISIITMDNDDTFEGEKAARNFLGLSNNILYVGCIYTNTPFSDKWHNYNNTIAVNDTTYQQKKQDYINRYYAADDDPKKIMEGEFQKRNDGTAKNMIGVSSGYALKIQNVTSQLKNKSVEGTTNVTTQVDSVFYGPIVGVAEVNLMSSRLNEGGGYIYADNIHDRAADDATSSNGTGKPDFLMTTGNFVFPHNETGRYILDDCYVKTYDETLGKGQAAELAHYWYIEGYNYFYNVHITGYTSDSRNVPLKFDADNTDLLSIMKGAKAGQKVTLHSIRWRSEHVGTDTSDDKYDECDIDGNYKDTGVYPATMTEGAATYGNATLNQRWNDSYYKLRLSAFDDTTVVYRETPAEGSTTVPLHGDLQRASNMLNPTVMTGELLTDEPVIALQLVDAVDNTTEAYYKKHLSETCKATIVLTVPALDENNHQQTGETSVTAIYTSNDHVGLEDKVIGDKNTGVDATVDMSGTYYYFDDNTHEYKSLDMSSLRYKWGNGTGLENFAPITSLKVNKDGIFILDYDDKNGHSGSDIHISNIYTEGPSSYTYTLYLTIDYVQGPEVRGHINIHNCALPGEMVRLTTEGVKISADESMKAINRYWRIGMRKFNEETKKWEFADDTEWKPLTATIEGAPKGYDSYIENGSVKNGVFSGCVFDEDDNYLDVPVYYFMNGYGVQFGVEFNGLEGQIFPANMADADSLLIHNYHRMDTHSTNSDLHLHLSEAAARAKAYEEYVAYKKAKAEAGYDAMTAEEQEAWNTANPEKIYVAPLNRPRVYLEDEKDMTAFYHFIDSVGRNIDGTAIYVDSVQLGTKKYVVPQGGKYVRFFMEDNIAMTKEYYHTPSVDFEGEFDGRGHTIDLTDKNHATDANAPTFLKNVAGSVYNLGVLGRPLAASVTADEKAHVFNSFVYGMNGKNALTVIKDAETAGNVALNNCYDLKVAEDDDFKYGRVAYNLNKYYLAERYRRAKGIVTPYNDCIEKYYSNEDYQYAHRTDARTGKNSGIVYLRTSVLDLPAYGSHETRHDMTHALDTCRTTVEYLTEDEAATLNERYNAEYEFEINAATTGSDVILEANPYKKDVSIKNITYTPLFNESKVGQTVVAHGLRNDYILFGQNLTETPDALPTNIVSRLNSVATNRVWRAGGFYGSMKDEGFYYNALTNMTTMVHDPRLTAVDLTCQRDGEITAASYQNDENALTSVNGAADEKQSVFFAPTKDTPEDATYWKFGVAEAQQDGTHVTQNLLVYTAATTNAATKVRDAIEYTAETPTTEIRGHRVVVGSPKHNADLLHLVDKENFNAPMALVAANAWYDRDPSMETGYVEAAGQGWESVALPFTVQKTTLSEPIERFWDYADEAADPTHVRNTKKEDQSEISFFYGEADNVDDNPNIINHEYWLRNLTGMEHPEAAGSKLSGIFKRPVKGQETGGFAAYTPFVVSFPGTPFYEFDMTDRTITFSAQNADVAVTDTAVAGSAKTIVSGTRNYTHTAAFMNEEGATYTYAIALKETEDDTDNKGDRFTNGAPVYPFRAKIVSNAVASGGAKAAQFTDLQTDEPEYIYISALGISLEDKGIEEPETEDVIESDGMRIYPASGRRIVVESTYATTVNVYSASGQLVRVLDVRPGTSIYSGFTSGVHVVEQKKMMLK